jgi:hypothetical protein
MTPRLADPVLPLQTMNATCNSVREAAAAAAARRPPPDPEQLLHLKACADSARVLLQGVYMQIKGDVHLEGRVETAGKAILRLMDSLQAAAGRAQQ